MTRLIDLTLTLGSERVSTVPGLAGVETTPLQTHETHARSNQRLCLATHIGTHVDAPYHFVPGATTVDEMPLEKYMGPAILLDLRDVARGLEPLTIEQVQAAGGVPDALPGKIAVLFTAWAENESGGPRFYGHGPYLGTDTAAYLADNGVNAVAVDFPIDKHPPTPQSTIHDFPYTACCWGRASPSSRTLSTCTSWWAKSSSYGRCRSSSRAATELPHGPWPGLSEL